MFRVSSVACALLLAGTGIARADPAGQSVPLFTDDACPAATPLGRRLNELNAQTAPSPQDLVATAKGLVDVYRSCVASFDGDSHGHGGDSSSDYVVTHRMYARLALARSLQRTGSYAAQLHDPATAKADYAEAVKSLDEVESIGGNAQGSEGAETKLLQSSRSLRADLVTAENGLPTAGASALPSPPGRP